MKHRTSCFCSSSRCNPDRLIVLIVAVPLVNRIDWSSEQTNIDERTKLLFLFPLWFGSKSIGWSNEFLLFPFVIQIDQSNELLLLLFSPCNSDDRTSCCCSCSPLVIRTIERVAVLLLFSPCNSDDWTSCCCSCSPCNSDDWLLLLLLLFPL